MLPWCPWARPGAEPDSQSLWIATHPIEGAGRRVARGCQHPLGPARSVIVRSCQAPTVASDDANHERCRTMRRMPILCASALALLATTVPAVARDPLPPMPPASSFSAHVTNVWFPLVPGSRAVYLGTKDGARMRDVGVVSHGTRTIDGVACAVVEDRLYLRGTLEERTTDWYSQDAKGNVWYLGEETAEL